MPAPRLVPFLALLAACGGSGSTATTTTTGGSGGATGSATTSTTGGAGGSTGTASAPGGGGQGGGAPACPVCGEPVATGVVGSDKLNELSGIVASATHPGVFWVHNDSGDSARFFGVDADGKRLATVDVKGVNAVDWEDIGRGPCPGGTCLFLADIGDNKAQRLDCAVYRVLEPAVVADGNAQAEALPFSYPDGPRNAETLLVHPVTGALTIVSKVSSGESSIYEFPMPLTPGIPVVLKKVGTVTPPSGSTLYTGGDVHPAGEGVLLRTYGGLWFHRLSPGETVATALARPPCPMPVAFEVQGEAVGWLADGKGYVTVGEGAGVSLNRVACPGM